MGLRRYRQTDFLATGVCSLVGGIRYSPLTEEEQQALAFDEIEPSDDGMSYDEWEAVRIVKCIAALKLMRRCRPLFSPFALAACRSYMNGQIRRF